MLLLELNENFPPPCFQRRQVTPRPAVSGLRSATVRRHRNPTTRRLRILFLPPLCVQPFVSWGLVPCFSDAAARVGNPQGKTPRTHRKTPAAYIVTTYPSPIVNDFVDISSNPSISLSPTNRSIHVVYFSVCLRLATESSRRQRLRHPTQGSSTQSRGRREKGSEAVELHSEYWQNISSWRDLGRTSHLSLRSLARYSLGRSVHRKDRSTQIPDSRPFQRSLQHRQLWLSPLLSPPLAAERRTTSHRHTHPTLDLQRIHLFCLQADGADARTKFSRERVYDSTPRDRG
jgi:hypothetical protein